MQRKWKRRWQRAVTKLIVPPLVASGIWISAGSTGFALPSDVTVTAGTAVVSQHNDTMNVNQTTNKLIINSKTFVIDTNETLNFIQPSPRATALWRVIGNDSSKIFGSLNANGQVFLVNPNGILFSSTAKVDVGGLVASTLNIADSDFLSGNYRFSGNGGSVINEGVLTAADGGYIVLMGGEVKNGGVIIAQQGTVALAAGNAVTLDLAGDGLLNLVVDQAAVDASVANHSLIQADGGQVLLTAKAAGNLVGTVVNNSGIIKARSINSVNGVIRLDGNTSGTVINSGTLDVSGGGKSQTGGSVKVLGDNVELAAGTNIDASGNAGGGTVLIGGNYQGKGTEQNAAMTTVAAGAAINADAVTSGSGGKVVVWANDKTQYDGTISAKGGARGGNGGSAEVSGKNTLEYKGTTDLTAANGSTGNLLLDPADYTIAAAGGDMTPDQLAAALKTANITIKSSDGKVKTNGSGNITVTDPLATWDSGTTLTLSAYNDININAALQNTGGGSLVLRADNTGIGSGTVNFGTSGSVSLSGGSGTVSIYYNPASYTDTTTYSTVSPITSTGGSNAAVYNPYMNKVSGGKLSAYMLVNSLSDLQRVQSNLAGVYALGKDIDASATKSWNSGAGFEPIGTSAINGSTGFTGVFDGNNQVISGLYINKPNVAVGVGLFGGTNGATIRNVGLENVEITGSYHIGSLVGEAISSNISNCYSTGKVSTIAVPGLSIYPSGYSGPKLVYENVAVGGLIGLLTRAPNTTIKSLLTNCYSSVAVAGAGDGSKDANNKTLHNCGRAVGGLVGYLSDADVDSCYSTGQVNDVGSYAAGVGGLIGYMDYSANQASVSNCYTTSKVTSTSNGVSNRSVGGFIGQFDSTATITNCYAAGTVARIGDPGSTLDLYAFTATSFGSIGNVTNCYWDTSTYGSITPPTDGALKGASYSNQNQGNKLNGRINGLATADMMNSSKYKGWDFTNVWYMFDGYTYPFLRSEYSTTIRNSHQLQLMAMDPGAAYTLANNIDLSGYSSALYGFLPIGSTNAPFTGSFNGNGHTISGLTITVPSTYTAGATDSYVYAGLFGYIQNASVGDVILTGVNITAANSSNLAVGSLAGFNDGGDIDEVHSDGSVGGSGLVGGLVGGNTGSITNCYTGVIGTVKGNGAASAAGGLAGANSGSIKNSYSAIAVTGDGTTGGLVGNGTGGTISSSIWDKTVSNQNFGVGSEHTATGVTGLTADEMKDSAHYSGWDTSAWYITSGIRPILMSQYENSSTISSYNQLLLMLTNLNGIYKLGADIDLTGIDWAPIGSQATPFTGTLIGNGHTLNGLTIANSTAEAIGLFGSIKEASISNVKLTNVNIIANNNNLYVGSLAGYSGTGSVIKDCTASGQIIASATGSCVGGLVGYNGGSIETSASGVTVAANGDSSNVGGLAGLNAGSITHSYNTGSVTAGGANTSAGGVAGTNEKDYSIEYSYNTGKTTGSGNNNGIGGIAGKNAGTITSVYNQGETIGEGNDSRVGGLAGENAGGITNAYSISKTTGKGGNSSVGGLVGENSGNIDYAYSVGATTTTNGNVGGLAGVNNGEITNARWDTVTSGQGSGTGSGSTGNTQGLTTAAMMKSTGYSGWDFTAWGLAEGVSFPYLKALYDGTPQFVSGQVIHGGSDKSVNLVYKGNILGQTATIAANGFYYLTITPDKAVPSGSVLLTYVAGDGGFKANSAYLCQSAGGLAGIDLIKDTLIVNGGSGTVTNDDLATLRGTLADDLIFTTNTHPYTSYYPGSQDPEFSRLPATLLTVEGNLVGHNYSPGNGDIHTTGSISITVPGDFYINSYAWRNYNMSNSGVCNDQQLIAGGDITINCGGNFVMYYGVDLIKDGGEALFKPNEKPRLIAGGDITINCGGNFVNKTGVSKWVSDECDNGKNEYYNYFGNSSTYYLKTTSGSYAFQLTGNGRWKVYAKDRSIYSTTDNEAIFYDVRGVSTNYDYWYQVAEKRRYITQGDEMVLDSTGGMVYDYAVWAGETAPSTGNGFIYSSAKPTGRMLTSPQVMRREAISASYGDKTSEQRATLLTVSAPGLGQENLQLSSMLPFLTVVDGGVALPDEASE